MSKATKAANKEIAKAIYKAMSNSDLAKTDGDKLIALAVERIKLSASKWICGGSFEDKNACGKCKDCVIKLKGMKHGETL